MGRVQISKERMIRFRNGEHLCGKCKQYKSLSEFYKCKENTLGLRFECKQCAKERWVSPKYSFKKAQLNYSLKTYWVTIMGGKCQRCGYNEFNSGLEFHHVNPNKKIAHPYKAINTNNKQKAASELDKCCLLCSNCHRTYEAGRWEGHFVKADFGYTLESHWLTEPLELVEVYNKPSQLTMVLE